MAYPLYLTGNEIWGALVVVAFIALMILALVILRRFQMRGVGPGGSVRRMRVFERMVVGREATLQVIQVGDRLLLVGVGRDGVRLICELDPGYVAEPADAPAAKADGGSGFGTRFWHNMKVNMGLLPKGTPHMTPKTAAAKDEPAAQGAVSFDTALRQAADRQAAAADMIHNPISAQGQRSGSRHAETGGPESPPPAPRKPAAAQNYQSSIERMAQLSEPDNLDRRAKPAAAPGAPPPAAPPRPEAPAGTEPGEGARGAKIDDLLDKIAERQSRYKQEKDNNK